jgi:hypothetical protein
MKPIKRTTLLMAALSLLVGSAGLAKADLVLNGGFEDGDFTGWTKSANFYSFTTFVTANVDGFTPNSGSYFAALGAVGSDQYLSQSLATTVGQTYQLSYALASNDSFTNDFSASVGGVTLFSQTDIAGTGSYSTYTFDFTATTSSTTLQFGFRDDPGYLALDSVSVTAIPEPSGFALLGMSIGCLAVGYVLLRRKLAAV